MKAKLIKLASLVAVLGFTSSFAQAGTANATVNATLEVAGTCSFSQPTYSVTINGTANSNPTGMVQLQATCSNGMTANITPAYATAYSGSGANGEVEAIAYKDAGYSVPLIGSNISVVADGNPNNYPVYLKFRNYQDSGVVRNTGTFVVSLPMQINF